MGKIIPGFDGKYTIDKEGSVYSLYSRWGLREKPRKLSVYLTKGKYKCVKMVKNGNPYKGYVHKLLAKAFIENPENKPLVNHIDGNSLNNSVNNLEWATSSEDQKHAFEMGLNTKEYASGENNNKSTLTENEVLDIRNAWNLGCFVYRNIAEAYNVSIVTARNIIKRKTWKHI